ncbi:regulator of chromosome condensation 1/beta-lactamase-inhibitor protein II [Aspergillus egyptiacus]|nr:regulator of chromosome condensation 1/beta-lactamase-inhibitor protein II [Aspergillus egyptiacus]
MGNFQGKHPPLQPRQEGDTDIRQEKCVKSGSDVEENTIIGFRPGIKIQHTPMLIPELNGIRALAAGAQHILAINVRKAVLTWGANNRGQLGRKVLPRQRDNTSNLIPRACTFPGGKWGHTDQFDVVTIGAGEYHSFAVRMDGEVYAWGCNMYGQTGIAERLLQEDSCIPLPRVVWTLPDQQTRSITGGTDHSVAVTQDGRCLSWASVANAALVIRREDLQNDITDHHDTVDSRMLRTPTLVTCIDGSVAHAVAGPSHTLVVTRKGKAFGWGSNSHFEVSFIDRSDVESPKLIQSEELERRRVVGAAAGKHFSILLTERLEEWSEHLPS